MRLLELNFLRVRTTNLEKIPELNFVHFHRRQIILIVVTSKNYSFPIPGPFDPGPQTEISLLIGPLVVMSCHWSFARQ